MAQPVYIDDSPLLEVGLLFAIADITDDDFIEAIEEFSETIPSPYSNLLIADLVDNTPKRSLPKDSAKGLFSNLIDKASVNPIITLYDQGTLNYAVTTNKRYKTVDVKTIEDVVARIESKHYDRIQQLVERRGLGKIKNSEFERLTAKELKALHTQSYLLGRGGINAMTSKDKMVLQNLIRDELTYFKKFAQDLKQNKLSMPQFRDRASMYSEKSRGFYEKGREFSALENGFVVERRVRLSSESCQPCLNFAAKSWQPIGTLPTPTYQCDCRSRCKCIKEYSKEIDKLAKPEKEVVNQTTPNQKPTPKETKPKGARPKETKPINGPLTFEKMIDKGKALIGKELDKFQDIVSKINDDIIIQEAKLAKLEAIADAYAEANPTSIADLFDGDTFLDKPLNPAEQEYQDFKNLLETKKAEAKFKMIVAHDDIVGTLVRASPITDQQATEWLKDIALEDIPYGKRDEWKNEMKLFYRISGGKINTLKTVGVDKRHLGASATLQKGSISLGSSLIKYRDIPDRDNMRDILWHEMSHHIQYSNPTVRDIEVAWRKNVAGDELEFIDKDKASSGMGYRSPKFKDQYTGRYYDPVEFLDTNGQPATMDVTEILTTGAQDLSNAKKLIENLFSGDYREHLYLTAGLLAYEGDK